MFEGDDGTIVLTELFDILADSTEVFARGPKVFRVFSIIIAEPTLTVVLVYFGSVPSEPAMAGEKLDCVPQRGPSQGRDSVLSFRRGEPHLRLCCMREHLVFGGEVARAVNPFSLPFQVPQPRDYSFDDPGVRERARG